MNPVKEALLWASQNPTLADPAAARMRFVQRSVARFMPGETAEDAIAAARRMARDAGIPATFTRLGENTTDLAQAAEAAGDYLRLLDRIEELGLDAEISVKLTQLGFDQDPAVTATHVAPVRRSLGGARAHAAGSTWKSALTSRAPSTSTRPSSSRSPHVGLCLQAYLRRTFDDVQAAAARRRRRSGSSRAPTRNRRRAAFTSNAAIDESFRRLSAHLVHGGARRVVLGSHDTDLIAGIDADLGHDRFEVAMLYGIRSDEQRRLAAEGYLVRTLISYGPSWYPWFMRRLAEKPVENTAACVAEPGLTDVGPRSAQ